MHSNSLPVLAFFVAATITTIPSFASTPDILKIDTSRISESVKVLASDEFQGRAPGGPGEEKTVSYLIERFTELGLLPGGDNGSWTQIVPLIRTQLQTPAKLELQIGLTLQPLNQASDVAVRTPRPASQVSIDKAPVVFVGFGANAPERDWDDYGDMDLKGTNQVG